MTDRYVFTRQGPVFLPAHNKWAEDEYLQSGTFDLDPVDLPAWSTSGSPVLLNDQLFVGFLDSLPGGRFRSDGTAVEVVVPDGGRLFVREGQDPYLSWREYNSQVLSEQPSADRPVSDFFDTVEYCTWVEQKKSVLRGEAPSAEAAITEDLVLRYLERIDKLGFPPGKFTVDFGWSHRSGAGGFGDWDVATERFPDLERVAKAIRDAGHVPGLWFAPGRLSEASRYLTTHADDAVPVDKTRAEVPVRDRAEYYALPTDELSTHYQAIFAHYNQLGFRKFKLDLHYGSKPLMRAQLARCYHAIKEADPEAEVEHHIPDIFASRYCDVVRTNDVLISPGRDWRALTVAHWRVSDLSSPDRILNLDHVGGNDPSVSEQNFLDHWAMYAQQRGHPVISLLPDHYSTEAVETIREGLWGYVAR